MATKEEDAVTNLFVTSTHTPVLFFSTAGKVYRLKVWRLPEGAPQARGRPMVNLLPLAEGETISTVLPLPEDEAEWKNLHVVFATAHGGVRRNSMDAFANVPSNGKFAMRFEEDATDRLIGVALLTEEDDVLLATKQGKAIRFEATAVREFQSRTSTGVRGISLKENDEVISLSILKGFPATTDERDAYLRAAPWKENENAPTLQRGGWPNSRKRRSSSSPSPPTATASALRPTNIAAPIAAARASPISRLRSATAASCASFPAHNGEQLMLVTDQAKLIRTTVGDIRIAGRNTQGVTIFRVAEDEHVVSAARIDEEEEPENEAEELIAEEIADTPPSRGLGELTTVAVLRPSPSASRKMTGTRRGGRPSPFTARTRLVRLRSFSLAIGFVSVISGITERAIRSSCPTIPMRKAFILHWGEMGTNGASTARSPQIHALLYLSDRPLAAEEISRQLGLARSNVSTALKELQGYGIVRRSPCRRRPARPFRRRDRSVGDADANHRRAQAPRDRPDHRLARRAQAARSRRDEATPPHVRERITRMHEFIATLGQLVRPGAAAAQADAGHADEARREGRPLHPRVRNKQPKPERRRDRTAHLRLRISVFPEITAKEGTMVETRLCPLSAHLDRDHHLGRPHPVEQRRGVPGPVLRPQRGAGEARPTICSSSASTSINIGFITLTLSIGAEPTDLAGGDPLPQRQGRPRRPGARRHAFLQHDAIARFGRKVNELADGRSRARLVPTG